MPVWVNSAGELPELFVLVGGTGRVGAQSKTKTNRIFRIYSDYRSDSICNSQKLKQIPTLSEYWQHYSPIVCQLLTARREPDAYLILVTNAANGVCGKKF